MKKELLEKYLLENIDSAFRFAYTYMKNREDAEDVVSESIVKALKSVRGLREESNIKPWFYKIIANTALTHLRGKSRVVYLDFDDLAEESAAEDDYSRLGFESIVQRLDEKYKGVIVLRFFEDMQIREIAEVLGLNENTVKTRLYTALKILKVQMEDGEYEKAE